MPSYSHRLFVPLCEALSVIRDADLLLYRRAGLIALAGRGVHSHAAKASWWKDDLYCCEVRELKGGRAVTLESQVQRYPGRIDVFRSNPNNRWPEYNRGEAARYMRRLAGCDYGYLGVLSAALLHLPLVRRSPRGPADEDPPSRRPPFCSQACVMADRIGGGVDPVPHLADRHTEPADLARSPFYRYLFTLTGS